MCELAAYAPLNGSFVRLIEKYLKKQPPCEQGIPFYTVRTQVFGTIHEIVRHERLDTTNLCRVLTSVSPSIEVTRDQIWLWKQKGALRYIADESPNVHSAIANGMARRFHQGRRGWNPHMSSNEPLFYCKIEVAPGEPAQMVAYPFGQNTAYLVPATPTIQEEAIAVPPPPSYEDIPHYVTGGQLSAGWYRLPASALIYSPYEGAALREDGTVDPKWLRVEGGAIRFFGEVKMRDLAHWDSHVARMELDEEQIPDIVAAAKILALQLLARQRLPREQDRVHWKACSFL